MKSKSAVNYESKCMADLINPIPSIHSPSNHIGPQRRHRLKRRHELAKLVPLPQQHERNTHQETQNTRNAKLIPHTPQPILEAFRLHHLLIFVTTHGGKAIGQTRTQEGTPCKVQLIHGCQDDTADDDWQTEPLGLADGLFVDELGEDCGEGWFGGLDDLAEGDGTGGEGEDGGGVGAGVAECDGEQFDDLS